MDLIEHFTSVYVLDFEFLANDGERQHPICLVYKELISGTECRMWIEEGAACPFPTDSSALFVGYFASAEWGCFLSLSWELPQRCIDLYAEYRLIMNGRADIQKYGLLDAARSFGIPPMETSHKIEMRDLIIAGGPWSEAERVDILEYCAQDVALTVQVFGALWANLNSSIQTLSQALFRGRFTCAVARMEFAGIPVDTGLLAQLHLYREDILKRLISTIDADFRVYEGTSFKHELFRRWVCQEGISWPLTDTRRLKIDDDTFKRMSLAHPKIVPLHQLRKTVGQLRQIKLTVGLDGRNRALLSPFGSKTGRNQPSTTKFIFGNAAWLRSLIKPDPGFGLAYIDFSSQEIAIAAALSGDRKMWQAYTSGDPYMAFAIQAGLAPAGATKATHKDVRNRCKQVVLGVGYGMGAETMAIAAGIHVVDARALLQSHKQTYRKFWEWAETNQMRAMMGDPLITPLGWRIEIRRALDVNARSLLNWPMQSTGADMMRLAACLLTEGGIEVCAPVHDAFLVRFHLELESEIVPRAQEIMMQASEQVMGADYQCRVDAEIIRSPDRYVDERGVEMFEVVRTTLAELET